VSAASSKDFDVDERTRAAIVWDYPTLDARREDIGCKQWVKALQLTGTDFGELQAHDPISVAAHIVHGVTGGDADVPELREILRHAGSSGELFELLIALVFSLGDMDWQDVFDQAADVVERIVDPDLRGRLLLRLAVFAGDKGDVGRIGGVLSRAIELTGTDTRLGVVIRRMAFFRGIAVFGFDPFTPTDTPADPLLSLPWVQDVAFTAVAGLAVSDLEARLADVWDTSLHIGRTRVNELQSAQLQTEWCGSTDLRNTVRKLLSAHLLSGAARFPEQTQWALLSWAATGGKQLTSAIRNSEAALDSASAADVLSATQADPTVGRDATLAVALGLWDLLTDAACDDLLHWLLALPDYEDDQRWAVLLANLRVRRPQTWERAFGLEDSGTQLRMLQVLDADEVGKVSESVQLRAAEFAAAGERLPAGVRWALELTVASDLPNEMSRLAARDILELLDWRSDVVPTEVVSHVVRELVAKCEERLVEAAGGKLGFGGQDIGALLGRVAAYLPQANADVVAVLVRSVTSTSVSRSMQFGALQGLAVLRGEGHISEANLEAIRGLQLAPARAVLGESIETDVLRAAQLRVLAPDLTADEIAWLAVCCRGQDRQARLVAVVALGESGDAARITVDWSLVACLFDPDDSVVVRALEALAMRRVITERGAAAVVSQRLSDLVRAGSPSVRRAAAWTAGRMQAPDVRHLLADAQTDRRWTVRDTARAAAGSTRL
jgi:hypothetical protein